MTVGAGTAAYKVSLTGGTNTIAGATTFNNTGTLTLGDGGDTLNFTGGVNTANVTGAVTLNGTVNTTNTTANFGALGIAGTSTVNAGSGAINFNSTLNGANALTVTSSGTKTFTGVVGGAAALASLTSNGGGITAINGGSVKTTGLQDYSADSMSLGANTTLDTTNGGGVTGGDLKLGGVTGNTRTLILNAGTTGAITSSTAGIDGVSALTLANSNGVTFLGSLGAGTPGSVTITDTSGTIAFQGATTKITSLNTANKAYNVAFNGAAAGQSVQVTNDVNFLNTGTVTLGDNGDTLTFTGGLGTKGNASNPTLVNIGGTVYTSAQQVDLGTVVLSANSKIDTTNNASFPAGAALNIASIDGTASKFDATLKAGQSGALVMTGVGTNLGQFTLLEAKSVDLQGAITATGKIDITAYNGTVTTGAGLVQSTGNSISVVANNRGTTAPISVGSGGLRAAGDISLSAADAITVNNGGGVKGTGAASNVTLVAGAVPANLSSLFTGLPAGLVATGGAANAPILVNGPIWSGNGTGYGGSGYTANLFSTGNIVQSQVNDAGIQVLGNSSTTGGLRAVTFNDTSGAGAGTWLDLQNNKTAAGAFNCSVAGSGNCVGPLLLEARLAAGGTSAYAPGNISYSSINGTTIFGVGTAADIVFKGPSHNIVSGNIKGTNVYFYGYGSSATVQNNDGSINMGIQMTNSDINLGNAGGSLNLIADGPITLNGNTATENTVIGSRTTNATTGSISVTKFNHALKLVSSSGIDITGSLYLQGALDLRAGASSAEVASLAHLNSPAVGGGAYANLADVKVSVPAGRQFPVELVATNINVGAANAPVHDFSLDASLTTATATSGGLVAVKDAGVLMASAGGVNIYYTGAMQLKGGTATATTSNDGIAFAGASAKLAGETLSIIGSGGLASSMNLFAGTATSNSSTGSASAVADVTLFGRTSVNASIGGSLVLKSGTSTRTGGSASAAALIDPVVPLTISTGGNLVVQAGVGAGSAAQILNQGDIVLSVGGAGSRYSYTRTTGGAPALLSGLVLIGGAGSGLFGANRLAIVPGDEIKLTGSGYSLLFDGGLASASINANSPRSLFALGDLLNFLVYATNEQTLATRLKVGRSLLDDSDSPSCN
jgi:hypothetical protein